MAASTKIVFIDFEASSLESGSYPIEVAWVDGRGQGESYLIRPTHPAWTAEHWSAASERIHGIPRKALVRTGVPAGKVAARAAAALGGARVFADQPAFDGYWLAMLFDAGPVPEAARPEVLNVTVLYGETCRKLAPLLAAPLLTPVAARLAAEAEEAEALRRRARHRALPDAEGLWWIWRDLGRRVEAEAERLRAALSSA